MKPSKDFIDKFRQAVNLYEICVDNIENHRGLNGMLQELCLNEASLYQSDPAKHTKRYFIFNSSTPLSYRVLRYIFAEDVYFFTQCYKSLKERELAKAVELMAEAIKV